MKLSDRIDAGLGDYGEVFATLARELEAENEKLKQNVAALHDERMSLVQRVLDLQMHDTDEALRANRDSMRLLLQQVDAENERLKAALAEAKAALQKRLCWPTGAEAMACGEDTYTCADLGYVLNILDKAKV